MFFQFFPVKHARRADELLTTQLPSSPEQCTHTRHTGILVFIHHPEGGWWLSRVCVSVKRHAFVFHCVCVCVYCPFMCVFQWSLTLLCPDTPDEYLQDTVGAEQSMHCQAFGQAAVYVYVYVCVCECVCLCMCKHQGIRARETVSIIQAGDP